MSDMPQDDKIEFVARALCRAKGDDPDVMAYPPMMHMQAQKPNVIIVPFHEWHQPKPLWNWYVQEASIAIDAMNAYLRS